MTSEERISTAKRLKRVPDLTRLVMTRSILGRRFTVGRRRDEELGIEKYEAPIPARVSARRCGRVSCVHREKTDAGAIQNLACDYEIRFVQGVYGFGEDRWHLVHSVCKSDAQFGVCGRQWQC